MATKRNPEREPKAEMRREARNPRMEAKEAPAQRRAEMPMKAAKGGQIPSKGGSAHPGFQQASASIARKEGVSPAAADRILGAAKANASAKAIRRNPALKNMPGKKR